MGDFIALYHQSLIHFSKLIGFQPIKKKKICHVKNKIKRVVKNKKNYLWTLSRFSYKGQLAIRIDMSPINHDMWRHYFYLRRSWQHCKNNVFRHCSGQIHSFQSAPENRATILGCLLVLPKSQEESRVKYFNSPFSSRKTLDNLLSFRFVCCSCLFSSISSNVSFEFKDHFYFSKTEISYEDKRNVESYILRQKKLDLFFRVEVISLRTFLDFLSLLFHFFSAEPSKKIMPGPAKAKPRSRRTLLWKPWSW